MDLGNPNAHAVVRANTAPSTRTPSYLAGVGRSSVAPRGGWLMGRGRGRFHTGGGGNNYMGSSRFGQEPLICQVCEKPGHGATTCRKLSQFVPSSSSHALTAYGSPSTSFPDPNWYPNTGATHHLTPDLENLNLNATPYQGTDMIRVGNGQGLAIQNIGSGDGPYTSPRKE